LHERRPIIAIPCRAFWLAIPCSLSAILLSVASLWLRCLATRIYTTSLRAEVRGGRMANLSSFQPHNPLIVQSDHTLLLELHNPLYEPARTAIGVFAELEKSPEHIHTYRITPLSLWNAAAAGLSVEHIATALVEFAKYPVPQNVLVDVRDLAGRWGRVQ